MGSQRVRHDWVTEHSWHNRHLGHRFPRPCSHSLPPWYLCIHTFIIFLITWHGLSPWTGSEFLKGNPISLSEKIQYENRNHLKCFKLNTQQCHGKTSFHWTFGFRVFLPWLSGEVWRLLTCSWQPHIREDDGQMVECGMWPQKHSQDGSAVTITGRMTPALSLCLPDTTWVHLVGGNLTVPTGLAPKISGKCRLQPPSECSTGEPEVRETHESQWTTRVHFQLPALFRIDLLNEWMKIEINQSIHHSVSGLRWWSSG